jgi:hypothetical protein
VDITFFHCMDEPDEFSFSKLYSVAVSQNVMIIFLLALSCTVIILLRDFFQPYFLLIILAYVIAFFLSTLLASCLAGGSNNMFDAAPAGWLFIAWVIYGLVFRDQAPLQDGVMWFQGAIALLVCFCSMITQLVQHKHFLLILILVDSANLFFPNKDMICIELSTFFLFSKVTLFYATYTCSDYVISIKRKVYIKRHDREMDLSYSTSLQIKFLQSFWILIAPRWFCFLSIMQVFYMGWENSSRLHLREMGSYSDPENTSSRSRRSADSDDSVSSRRERKEKKHKKEKKDKKEKKEKKEKRANGHVMSEDRIRRAGINSIETV